MAPQNGFNGQDLIDAAAKAVGSLDDSAPGVAAYTEPYLTDPNNWYKALPYGFAFTRKGIKGGGDLNYGSIKEDAPIIFYLPILPENINVVTQFATNTITTLYGVVEEHSEVRYYDIEISGTTGMAPKWVYNTLPPKEPRVDEPNFGKSTGRKSFTDGDEGFIGKLGDLSGGFLPEVTNTLKQVKNLAQEILTGGPKNRSGIHPKQTGYWAFHHFYKFLLRYKGDAAGVYSGASDERQTHPLQFLNYKDGTKYDAVIESFTLTRSAQSPMLYRYNIKMRCYNLRSLNASAQDSKKERLEALGLTGVEGASWFATATRKVRAGAKLVSLIV